MLFILYSFLERAHFVAYDAKREVEEEEIDIVMIFELFVSMISPVLFLVLGLSQCYNQICFVFILYPSFLVCESLDNSLVMKMDI